MEGRGVNDRSHHAEWLGLIDVSGPFLAEPVLKDAFPQGLEGLDAAKKRLARQAYDEWREALDLDDPEFAKIHRAWIDLVLSRVLELDENGTGDVLKSVSDLPETLRCEIPERGVSLRPDYAVLENRSDGRALLLVVSYGERTALTEPFGDRGYVASPAERMIELCRGTGVRLGLLTNGEQWMLVDAPLGAVISLASWYARHWNQDPVTLQAFVNLLGVRRFFVDRSQQLPALLDNSLKYQDEVTDALGEQVARAVEVLIQSLDRADIDRDRELLDGIEPPELYEAGLTVMMRIVFLLSAEERGLLLLGDERYEAGYAVSTLRTQLRSESEEILERRWDAWSRLLSIFRAVFAGVDHEAMRLPALGGSLFDPDRFPFLEGRKRGSRWTNDLATPLPIDNRTVLYLLDAVQVFQGRTLSYLALDIEQIGYVYEGLLERTVVRAKEVTLDLDATKNAKNPWVSLPELDDAAADGRSALEALLRERTGSAATRVRNDLDRSVDEADAEKLLTACHADLKLRDRVRPYFHFLRTDRWGYPIVYPKDAFMVATGTDRRETGTHYTPKSFTEAIVKETLEPLIYDGPAQGVAREDWKLKTPAALLDLKVCDPAMGSGAFLVQVCRWLADRLIDAWSAAEDASCFVTADGEVVDVIGTREPLRKDAEERVLTARRLIAERCLYGVDMNPLAVELAKLSIWLITLAKGRPFGFLDHNFRCGDSLLGITDVEQLNYLDINPGKGSTKKLFASTIETAVSEALELRSQLRNRAIRDIRDVEAMARLDESARRKLALPGLIADAFVAEVLVANGKEPITAGIALDIGEAMSNEQDSINTLSRSSQEKLQRDIGESRRARRPFHWPLEFPEVFRRENGGFDAFVGNPPFLGGQRISGTMGTAYHTYLVNFVTYEEKYSADLVVYFFLRLFTLLRDRACCGLLARRSASEGRNREVGLTQLIARGAHLYVVNTNIEWPGKASVIVHQIHISKGEWSGCRTLNGRKVDRIAADLGEAEFWKPGRLNENMGRMFQGTILLGEGFKVDEETAHAWILHDGRNEEILYPFVGGNEINTSPSGEPQCWVINFWDWPKDRAETYPAPFEMVRSKVKPVRDKNKRKARREKWWIYGETASGLYRAIGRGDKFLSRSHEAQIRETLERVLVISTGISKFPAFTFLQSNRTFSNKLCVLADQRFAVFALLTSDVHGVWAWAQKTSLGADLYSLVYAHGNIFETFPFPKGLLEMGNDTLEELGLELFRSRQRYMDSLNMGLTKFYNAFHDPEQNDQGLVQIRALQERINSIALREYGWDNLDLECGFHGVGYLPEGANIRFTMSEEARHEVLRRLLKLNRERVEHQASSGSVDSKDAGPIQQFDNDLFAEEGSAA